MSPARDKSKYLITLPIVLGLLGLLLFPLKVLAQNTIGLTISPPTFEISANPGETITNTIRVDNLSDEPVTVTIDRRNFTAVGELGSVDLTEEETSFALAHWLMVEPSEFSLEPKETRHINFTVSVPANAEPGGHFGSIVFKPGVKHSITQTGATVAQELGALLLVNIAGDIRQNIRIASFLPEKKFYEYGPIKFAARFANDGNVHQKIGGKILVRDMFGRTVQELKLEEKNVLPGAIRLTEGNLDKKWLLGKYDATLIYSYGDNQVANSTTSFMAFPYKLGGAIFFFVFLILVFIIKRRKSLLLGLKIIFSGKPPTYEQ